jgi:hypothetical protein
MSLDLLLDKILEAYDRVASGATHGSGGVYYANGRGTLTAVVLDVTLLEELARLRGRKVWGRDHDDRESAATPAAKP